MYIVLNSVANDGVLLTKEVFNQIAPGWYNFRHWSIFRHELEMLVSRWQSGKLLNIGCGHGADFYPFRSNFKLYGVDFSIEMLNLAERYSRKYNFTVNLSLADMSHLPFTNESFDTAISVASYHHVKGEKDRKSALSELRRVLRPGGEAFITVWNHWQPRFWFKPAEIYIPWHRKGKILNRYYYLFSYLRLERIVRDTGFEIMESFPESTYHFPLKYFSRNICLLVRKSVELLF